MSLTVNVPLRIPADVGVKVTLIVHCPPGARLLPQLLVCAKSPLATMPDRLNAASPTLLRVSDCCALVVFTIWAANASEAGERLAIGATPVPLRETVGAAPGALLVTVSVPFRLPRAVGVNPMLIVQLLPALSVLPQLLAWLKSPVTLMLLITSVAVPGLLKVTVCAALETPTA